MTSQVVNEETDECEIAETITPRDRRRALHLLPAASCDPSSRLGLLGDARGTLLSRVGVGVDLIEGVKRAQDGILAHEKEPFEEVRERFVELVASVLGHGDGEDATRKSSRSVRCRARNDSRRRGDYSLVKLLQGALLRLRAEEEDGDCCGKVQVSTEMKGQSGTRLTESDHVEASVGAEGTSGSQSSEHTGEGDAENTRPTAARSWVSKGVGI